MFTVISTQALQSYMTLWQSSFLYAQMMDQDRYQVGTLCLPHAMLHATFHYWAVQTT